MVFLRVVSIIFCLSALAQFSDEEECVRRTYDEDSFVCVCNSTYCDRVQKILNPSKGTYIAMTSTKSQFRFNIANGIFNKSSLLTNGGDININDAERFQSIFGFGGAFTDAAGINILSLSKPCQELLLQSYFSEMGLEYNMGRVPIGGTDCSTHGYTYLNDDENPDLIRFNLTDEDYIYKIPLIERAQKLMKEELLLIASCWSPPLWMKTNDNYYGFSSLKKEYYTSYANYHTKFLDFYQKAGIKFWGITTGNEPLNGLLITGLTKVSSVGWTPGNQAEWISQHLGPILRNSEHSDVKIMAIDDQRLVLPWWLDWMVKNENLTQYVDGVAFHWYWNDYVPARVLDIVKKDFPQLFILSTEASCGFAFYEKDVELGSWNRAEKYAQDIIEDINHWSTGWIDWNLALDEKGGPNWVDNNIDSAIIVNKTADEFYKQPMFYILGHFSKFITRNSIRINSTSSVKRLQVVAAVRTDDSVAVVILNRGQEKQIRLNDESRGSINLNLPAHSITSLLYT